MLNPQWLKTYQTLVELGHFTKTADKLYMTQPGVSQHLQKLEHACGHTLIKREKKNIELTEEGRKVYNYAKQLEASEAKLIEELNFDNPEEGICRLACSGAYALQLYPQLLSEQQKHPNRTFELEVAPNQKILSDLQEGNIDLGIVTHRPNPSLFDAEKIGTQQLCLALPYGTSLERNLKGTLLELGLIQHPDSNHYLSMYLELCHDPRLESLNLQDIPSSGYINQLSQILLPVAKGLGFTVLPKSAIEAFPLKSQIQEFETTHRVEETLYTVTLRGRSLPARYQVVQKMFK